MKMCNPPHPGEVLRELCLQPLGLSVTDWFITTEPVRALTITRAGGVTEATSRFSSSAMNATLLSGCGSFTRITRASIAWASWLPPPILRLIASATLLAAEKSVVRSSSWIESWASTAFGTARSTVAPPSTRPALRWLICTLLPAADAPAPPTTTLPWAIA